MGIRGRLEYAKDLFLVALYGSLYFLKCIFALVIEVFKKMFRIT